VEDEINLALFDDFSFNSTSDQDLKEILDATLMRGHFGEMARYKLFPNSFIAEKYYQLAQVR